MTQGHTLLERSVTELEQAVANCENGGRSRISGTEKRLAMQEAAMKERVAGLEVFEYFIYFMLENIYFYSVVFLCVYLLSS